MNRDWDAGDDAVLDDGRFALWRELASLHYVVVEVRRVIGKEIRPSPIPVSLPDGSRATREELICRVGESVATGLDAMRDIGDRRKAYAWAMSCTDLGRRAREATRAGEHEAMDLLLEQVDRLARMLAMSDEYAIGHGLPRRLEDVRIGLGDAR